MGSFMVVVVVVAVCGCVNGVQVVIVPLLGVKVKRRTKKKNKYIGRRQRWLRTGRGETNRRALVARPQSVRWRQSIRSAATL